MVMGPSDARWAALGPGWQETGEEIHFPSVISTKKEKEFKIIYYFYSKKTKARAHGGGGGGGGGGPHYREWW